MDGLQEIQEGFRAPVLALLTQFWRVIPLALFGFWLHFVLEIEPGRVVQAAGDGSDGDSDGVGDGGD